MRRASSDPSALAASSARGTSSRYVLPAPNGGENVVRQDVYPHAKPRPVTYTKPGQLVFGAKTRGGWFVGPHGLRSTLVEAGLPATPLATPPAPPARGDERSFPSWTLAVALAALGVLVASVVGVRIRRRAQTPAVS